MAQKLLVSPHDQAGLSLFLLSTAAALWRAKGRLLWTRVVILALTLGGLAVVSGSSPNTILATACAGLALIVGIEQVTVKRHLNPA